MVVAVLGEQVNKRRWAGFEGEVNPIDLAAFSAWLGHRTVAIQPSILPSSNK